MGLVAGADTDELWTWFERERDLRPHVRLDRPPVPGDGMGPEYVIAAAVPALAMIARSVCNYLAVRTANRGAKLILRVTSETGAVTEVEVERTTDEVRLARLLLAAAGERDAPAER
ncbi:hypothetical protein V5P93_005679 [Actinokineospora auranticolor]|uniref:effector-associated constant component EACC1 n=1 Tax=Actinokineospora auranticolor TaxID=155976 RepID=UPI000CEBBC67|nr:hypothetical protein [Actinokineospora auranticolor]